MYDIIQSRMLHTNDFFTPLTNEKEIITALEDWSRVGITSIKLFLLIVKLK